MLLMPSVLDRHVHMCVFTEDHLLWDHCYPSCLEARLDVGFRV